MGRSAGGGAICGGGKIDACFKMAPSVVKWSHLHIAGIAEDCGHAIGNQIVASGQLYMIEIGLSNIGRSQRDIKAIVFHL